MAKRYIRTLTMDRLGDDLHVADEFAKDLSNTLGSQISSAFSSSNGWKTKVEDKNGNDVLAAVVENETFEGEIRLVIGSDLKQGDGGMVRRSTLRISAQCSNSKRRNAREFQLGMEQKTGAVFGVIGGVVLAALISFGEILLLNRFHIYLPIVAFVIGYGIGYAIGHMSGGAVGGVIGKNMAKNERHEERGFDIAMEDWEAFVYTIATEVDDVAVRVETTPSSATII